MVQIINEWYGENKESINEYIKKSIYYIGSAGIGWFIGRGVSNVMEEKRRKDSGYYEQRYC